MVESGNERVMMRYLLGDLSEEQRVAFEETYFGDDRVFEELQIVETELIDSFVKGELPEAERQQFRANYLTSPDRREKVEAARCLMAVVSKAPAAKSPKSNSPGLREWFALPPAWQFAYGTAAFALLAIAAISLLREVGLHAELARIQTEKVQLIRHDGELEQQLANLKNSGAISPNSLPQDSGELGATLPLIASITLLPGGQRGQDARSNTLVVPRNTRWVELILPLQNQDHFSGYSAVVETATGTKVAQWNRLRSPIGTDGRKFLRLGIPAESLSGDTYVIRLSGRERGGHSQEIDDYTVQVLQR